MNEQIYANFNDIQSVVEEDDTPIESAKWGDYLQKPVAQSQWEEIVRTTVAELVAGSQPDNNDVRPYIRDKTSKQWLLVDSGAAVTCWPKRLVPDVPLDPKVKLRAVNGENIDTFGYHTITFHFGNKTYTHRALITALDSAILGWDFLTSHHVDIVWQGEKCFFKGSKNKVHNFLSFLTK